MSILLFYLPVTQLFDKRAITALVIASISFRPIVGVINVDEGMASIIAAAVVAAAVGFDTDAAAYLSAEAA